ncbi:hypothetical protein B0H14DRAFT_2580916 [Mycena olivaceomarginata]|nr:hypothetical protein B0H14DRAFT_2580916 [Mycena olivaceomarginata]
MCSTGLDIQSNLIEGNRYILEFIERDRAARSGYFSLDLARRDSHWVSVPLAGVRCWTGRPLPPFIIMQQDLNTKQDMWVHFHTIPNAARLFGYSTDAAAHHISFRDSYRPGELLLTSLTRTHSTPHTWSIMGMLRMGINWEILDS